MIGLLSNTNIEPLRSLLKDESMLGGYDRYVQELLDHNSGLHAKNIDHVFLFLSGDQLLGDLQYELPGPALCKKVKEIFESTLKAVRHYLEQRKVKAFVINSVVFSPHRFTTQLDMNSAWSFSKIEGLLNQQLSEFALEASNVLVLDWQKIVRAHGYHELTSEKYWYLGRIRLSQRGFSLLAKELDSLLSCHRGRTKKVLVLDADGVLWGGILGEDGTGGIELSEEGIGKSYRDFQKLANSLRQIGIVLALNSKNNEQDIREVFKNPMMVLKREDFAITRVNWKDKVSNLIEMSRELDLGLDSFVYLDDNPVERDFVQRSLPQVVVPDFPEDPVRLGRWFLEEVVGTHFPKVRLTTEDKGKTRQYKARVKRKELSGNIGIREFIRTLNIKLKIYEAPSDRVARIAQLTQKTNQFNMTTARYSEEDIQGCMRDKGVAVIAMEYDDRFGQEGIVGAAIVRFSNRQAFLDTYLLSCRVLGRNVEYAFMQAIAEMLLAQNCKELEGRFLPSGKNDVARTFYTDAGFTKSGKNTFKASVPGLVAFLQKKYHTKEFLVNNGD